MNYEQEVANRLGGISAKQIKIKEVRRQLTLDGEEEIEIEGWIKIKNGRMRFFLTITATDELQI